MKTAFFFLPVVALLAIPLAHAQNPPESCLAGNQRCVDGYNIGVRADINDDCPEQSLSNITRTNSFCLGFESGQIEAARTGTNSTLSGLQDFGEGLPIHVTTHVFHNENGVYIPWSSICSRGQGYLVQPCSALVGSNGTLTAAGDKAVGCIRNGLAAGIAATKMGLPLNLTKGILGFVAPLTGCSGIVDLNKIPTSNEFQYILRSGVR